MSGSESDKNFYDIVASEDLSDGKDGIKVQMEIGKLDTKGQRVIIARPTLVTKSGETMTIVSDNDNQKIHLANTPTRN